MYYLDNWSVLPGGGPYTAPEVGGKVLSGLVYGHPRHQDGKHVTTSRIEHAEGNIITTHSGSKYELRTPDPEYIKWLKANGHDHTNPVPYFPKE